MAAPTNAVVVITRSANKANQQQTLQNIRTLPSNMTGEQQIAALQQQLKGMALAIPKFDGQEDFDEWLIDFELLADELGKTTDAEKAKFIPFQLAGDARLKYKTLSPEDRASFQAIKNLLTETYAPTQHDLQSAKLSFYNRKQGQFENLRDFIAAAEKATRNLKLPAAEVVAVVINNCRPPIRRLLRTAQFHSLRELSKSPLIDEDYEDDNASPALNAIMAELKDMRAERDSRQRAVHFQPHGAMATDHRPRSLTPHNRDRRPQRSQSRERPQYYSAPNTPRKSQKPFGQATATACGRCGNSNCCGDFKCYARDKVCHRCNRRGHLKPQCKTKLRE